MCPSGQHALIDGILDQGCSYDLSDRTTFSFQSGCPPDFLQGADGNNTGGNTVSQGNSGGGVHGGGGTHPSTVPPIISSPILIDDVENIHINTPCIELKDKSNQKPFITAFNNLNTKQNYNTTIESGFGEQSIGNGQTNFHELIVNGATSVVAGDSDFATLHVHNDIAPNEGQINIKIFSPKDLWILVKDLKNNASNAGLDCHDSYEIMLSSEGVYAIKITDPSFILKGSPDFYFENTNNYLDKDNEYRDDDGNISQQNLQKLFFELLKNYNLEGKVDLFRADNVLPNQRSTNSGT
ncbi:hypothetical protein OX284_016265 [Flavobacterium sp. SUN046]|uniref:hypothetical protein n=1 Tax=Flavobacterium sp. SUN046 TaxID=3002440 RepID=UPI002DBEBD90|nr:hypothetical protein [Flavobacterium sp. SUN046]MEC4050991.1 hypothetical protein [Flavobacterium sp. SUN046]